MQTKLYKILSTEHVAPSTVKIRTERPLVDIKAGQCFNVGVPNSGVNREYSMYSPADAPYLDFLIKVVEGGRTSEALQKLTSGDSVELDGPYGEFCVSEACYRDRQHVFLASGTGIAPFHSFVLTYPKLNYLLIHGIRFTEEQYHSSDYQPGRYIACVTRDPDFDGNKMRVTDYLLSHPLDSNAMYYLCGNRNMIIDCTEILLDRGVDGSSIVSEVFF